MPVGECLTDIPIGATRIGDILGTVITTIITTRAFMRAITDIITTDTDTTIVLTVITQWTTTEYTAIPLHAILTDTETA